LDTADPGDRTILVVEDEPERQRVMVTALRAAGFQVRTAANGLDGYDRIKKQPPDLVVLEMAMPRQSGPLVFRKLRSRSRYADVRVLIISDRSRQDRARAEAEEMLEAEAFPPPDGVLEDPFDRATLVRRAGQLLGADVSAYLGDAVEAAPVESPHSTDEGKPRGAGPDPA
jgi:CheY-like chemotaxis protein